jgi:hypothetical protein
MYEFEQQSHPNAMFSQPSPFMAEFENLQSSTNNLCQQQQDLFDRLYQELINMQRHEQISFPEKSKIDEKLKQFSQM